MLQALKEISGKEGIENSTLRNNLLVINEMIEKESFSGAYY